MKRFLFVDNDVVCLIAYDKFFNRPGISVDTADSLKTAMSCLDHHKDYDAIIADLRLSGADSEEGFDIMRHVKLYFPKATTVLMTGFGSKAVRQKTVDMDIDYYLEKPICPHDLLNILDSREKDDIINE